MKVILESIVGSTAYGLNTPDSDVDKLGIYVQPVDYFIGLRLPTEKDFSVVHTDPDRTLHEVGKFCRLALKCNPTVTELLWTPEELLTVRSEDGNLLRKHRMSFVSAPLVRDAYLGYAKSQLVRLEERGDFGSDTRKRIKKHARHLARLMFQGYTLYTQGELPIKLENPEWYHEFGEKVSVDPVYGRDLYEEYEDKFRDRTVLPELPDTYVVDSLVKTIRRNFHVMD